MSNFTEKDLINSTNTINKLYGKLEYLDIYGSSIMLFITVTLIVLFVFFYFVAMNNSQAIKDDWVNQRCSPVVIPFVGFINKPDNKSIAEFTEENLNYCIQNILVNISGVAAQPFSFLINVLTTIFEDIQNAINTIRKVMAELRVDIKKIMQEILNLTLNVVVSVQQIFIGLKDAMGKAQGILSAALFTSLGTYYTLKALMGTIVELIIALLILFAAMIVGLWIVPFTWPAAALNTAIFVAISVPLTLIVLFMTEVLNIQSSAIPPVPSCLDKHTRLKMNNGDYKTIEDIKVGDILVGNNIVTAKMRLDATISNMYTLNGIIVSGTHVVKYNEKWIQVAIHPHSIPIPKNTYLEPYLYCLNTTTKQIVINDTIFTDWDEIYENNLVKILETPFINKYGNVVTIDLKENIHKLYNGFTKGTIFTTQDGPKTIEDINVGDKIGEDIIYGVVEFDGSHITPNRYFEYTGSLLHLDKKNRHFYHLLTHSNKFSNERQTFHDFNSFIDLNLDK